MVARRLTHRCGLPAALILGICFLLAVTGAAAPAPAAGADPVPPVPNSPIFANTDPGAGAPDVPAAAGSGWERRAGGNLRGVWFTDAGTGWIASYGFGVLGSTDGGATWPPAPGTSGYRLNALQFTDPRHGWAVGEGGAIVHTSDGGATWTPQTSGVTSGLRYVVFVDNEWGWAGDLSQPIRTTDGGRTWTPIVLSDLVPVYDPRGVVFFVDRQHGWLKLTNSNIWGFYRTTDGGATWRQTPGYPNGNTLFFLDALHGWNATIPDSSENFCYVERTTDGGDTWGGLCRRERSPPRDAVCQSAGGLDWRPINLE